MQTIDFYLSLFFQRCFKSFFIVTLGFVLRASSVTIFGLTIKTFLIVIDPKLTISLASPTLKFIGLSGFSETQFSYLVVCGLGTMILIQFFLNQLYGKMFLSTRESLLSELAQRLTYNDEAHKSHIIYDVIPHGYESMLKALEILFFYCFLLCLIAFIHPAVALILIVLLLIMVLFTVTLVKKRNRERQFFQKNRQTVSSAPDDLDKGIGLANHIFSSNRKNIVYSDLFGGVGMILVILLYLFYFSELPFTSNGLVPLFLALCIRFSINYTNEFSQHIGVLIDHRKSLSNLD